MQYDSLVALLLANSDEKNPTSMSTLINGDEISSTVTHFQLIQRVKRLANWLVLQGFSGQRAMLVYPPGLEFVEAFLACLFAQVIAVPVAPAPLAGDKHKVRRILSILRDCQPALVLGIKQTIEKAPEFIANNNDLDTIRWFTTDSIDEWTNLDCLEVKIPAGDDLAFLQYTSGSTNIPKGVMLSHFNVLHNLAHFDHGWGHEADSKLICWLPHFHDLGLLYGVLFPLYKGIEGYLIPPAAVMQKPINWLKAISTFGGTHSMGPNFVYDHCTDRISESDCIGLDLSTWRMALNAAEPIRGETIRKFNAKFAAFGLSANTLTGGFGLAEATCRVAAQNWDSPAHSVKISTQALNRGELLVLPGETEEPCNEFISCGPPALDTVVKIVDAQSCIECAPNKIGEIWVQSQSVSSGYWKRPEENTRTFGAYLAQGENNQPFMRSGDLGFIHQGDVFITGRIKDLIIVGGENYYPQDAEWAIEHAHPAFKPSCCAVFSVQRGGEEKVVVVQELIRHFNQYSFDDMVESIRRSVGTSFELPVEAIVLIKPGTTSKTSSGKIQRAASKAAFLEGTLHALHSWDRASVLPEQPEISTASPLNTMQGYLIARIAEITSVANKSIDLKRPFADYGLHSIDAMQISEELTARFGLTISPTAFYDHPSIELLVAHLQQLNSGKQTNASHDTAHTQIADNTPVIVGLACRFPGASEASAYWQLLQEGTNAISARTTRDGCLRYGGFLDNIDAFDNAFFSITPREAACLDPQQRIALETTWHALEDAGILPDALRGSQTGVFFGASSFDYGVLQLTEGQADAYTCQGSVLAVLANRISYQMDLCGPSFVVDTACSSALTALHLGARSLRDGESDVALVGAVHFLLAEHWDVALKKAGMLAKDGQCKTFDAAADGYVRGEGCGVVVMKRYADAIKDGNRIYGCVLGTGINQDGRSNGLTAPNGNAQEGLMRRTLKHAGVNPKDVSYVEAHGTGTPLGDPIECGSLARVMAERTSPCVIGSVKANIGHLEAASGMAGLIKVLLALRHNSIPQQINMQHLNPLIDLGQTLSIPSANTPWARLEDARRFAVVSAFGFSGTNACAVIADAPVQAPTEHSLPPIQPFVMSARDDAALARLAGKYADYFAHKTDAEMPQVLFAAACQRTGQARKFATVYASRDELIKRLQALNSAEIVDKDRSGGQIRPTKIAFVFSGQGIPLQGAGRACFNYSPVFRDALQRCDAILEPILQQTLATILYAEETNPQFKRPALAQPIQFALQYALTQMFKSFGVIPDVVLGHSLGEYAALVTAGAVQLNDALRLVIARGQLCEQLASPGSMAAIFADEITVTTAIKNSAIAVDLAAINGQHHCVVAGSADAVSAFCDYVAEEFSADFRKLPIERAYHSALIEPVVAPFTELANECVFTAPSTQFISNVSGQLWPQQQPLTATYLASHLRQPVRFADSLDALAAEQVTLAIEIGSKPVLCSIGQAYLDRKGPRWMPALKHGGDDWAAFINCLTEVFCAGRAVDWQPLYLGSQFPTVELPTYPFETSTRHWFQIRNIAEIQAAPAVAAQTMAAAKPELPVTPAAVIEQPIIATKIAITPATEIKLNPATTNVPAIEQELAALLAQVIMSAPQSIDPEKTFFELGVDSIGLVDFLQTVNKKFHTQLSVSEIFEHLPSIKSIAAHLHTMPGQMQVQNKAAGNIVVMNKATGSVAATGHSAPALATSGVTEQNGTLEAALTKLLAKVIQSTPEQIDINCSFFELGVDSISLVDFIQSVNKTYQAEFTPGEIFERYPRIVDVAECISSR